MTGMANSLAAPQPEVGGEVERIAATWKDN
jgi:hypothetical protein